MLAPLFLIFYMLLEENKKNAGVDRLLMSDANLEIFSS
jgi:hypothetical protein